jgi:hypothetical protein
MTETLLLIERVRNTIQLGESHFREFKSALQGPDMAKRPRSAKSICDDIAEAVVAFANAVAGRRGYLPWVEKNRAATTAEGYRKTWSIYLKPHLGKIELAKLETKHVTALLTHWSNQGKRARHEVVAVRNL